jgi:hypothetical protein
MISAFLAEEVKIQRMILRRLILSTVTALATLALILSPSLMKSSSISLLPKANLISQTYASDVAKGESIIKKMSGQVHNAVWEKLTKNKSTRDLLAAALGADKYLVSHGASSLTTELAPVLSPFTRSTFPRFANSKPHVSALRPKKKAIHSRPLKIGYDVFAPGLLPKAIASSPGMSATNNGITAIKTVKSTPILASLRAGLLDATGLSDHFAQSDTPLARLQRKVQKLKAELNKERQKVREAKAQQENVVSNGQSKTVAVPHPASLKPVRIANPSQNMASRDVSASPINPRKDQTSAVKKVSQLFSHEQHPLKTEDKTQRILDDILQESHEINHAVISKSAEGKQRGQAAVAALAPPHLSKAYVAGPPGSRALSKPSPAPIPVVLKRKARPLLCALPLLAENAGVDCHQV